MSIHRPIGVLELELEPTFVALSRFFIETKKGAFRSIPAAWQVNRTKLDSGKSIKIADRGYTWP